MVQKASFATAYRGREVGLLGVSALVLQLVMVPTATPVLAGPATSPDTEGWVRIVPQPVTINGRVFRPNCSGAPSTTSSTYSFYFRKGTADGLLVFFNGGGACWNSATCSKPRLAGDKAFFSGTNDQHMVGVYKAELLPGDGPARMGGLLDRANPQNPVRDWSMLFVPYCTGDVHSGSNTAQYTMPDTGKPFKIEHRGWDNMQVILPWLRANAAEPSRLLVSGSSAGAYGAATHFSVVRGLYPKARAVYLGDSGQGVTTPEFELLRNKTWNYTLPTTVFGPNAQNTADTEVVAKLAARFPKDRFAQFTTIQDATQTAFYAQMGTKQSCNAWTNKMLSELAIRQASTNFRSYVAQGDTHTILRAPLFYSEQSGGVPFTAWLQSLLSDTKMPENAICSTCSAPQPGCAP